MKIAILTSQYPTASAHYAHTFVHNRSVWLSKRHDLTVFVPSKTVEEYFWDEVPVRRMPSRAISLELGEFDIVYIHLLNIYPDRARNGWYVYRALLAKKKRVVFYLHGSEVQRYTSRLFDFRPTAFELARFIYKDLYFIPLMRRCLRGLLRERLITFMAPSRWMVLEAERNLGFGLDQPKIVPNGIAISQFPFSVREIAADGPVRCLTVRPLSSRKYAVDQAIRLFAYLPNRFSLDIYGTGKYLGKYRRIVEKMGLLSRVKFIEKFIPHSEMASVFGKYHIYVSPTRMDAQGVSMCEAMASGLLVFTSDNTAVPEFVNNMKSGVVSNDLAYAARCLTKIVSEPELMRSITQQAARDMSEISNERVMEMENKVLVEWAQEGIQK